MALKNLLLKNFFRLLRLLGILLIIYVSMVFYLKLSERHLAFPRALENQQARSALPHSTMRTCTLPDGTQLQGWILNDSAHISLLYYPASNEDAATFLAEVASIKDIRLIAFNYRGSAGNPGTPEEKHMEEDAAGILECATRNSGPMILAGRGSGSIHALNQSEKGRTSEIILIDPAPSIAAVLHAHYGVFFPEFLVHTKIRMQTPTFIPPDGLFILSDHQEQIPLTEKTKALLSEQAKLKERKGLSLVAVLKTLIPFN